MQLTKRKSLAKAYYLMFTTRWKLDPCSRSAVYRTLGTHERSSAVTATTASRLKRDLCDNRANPVINILSCLLGSSPLLRARHRKHPACVSVRKPGRADGDVVVETDIFQQENAAKDGNHFPGSFPTRRKETPIFPKPSVAAVALGRPLRSKLIESSVMRFRPLLSRNFNRPRGLGEERGASKSRQRRTLGMFARSYSIILRPAGPRCHSICSSRGRRGISPE